MKYVIKKSEGDKKMNGLVLSSNKIEIKDAPEPAEVILPLWGLDNKKKQSKLKAGVKVLTGEELIPGVFSTVTGTIKGVESITVSDFEMSAVRIELAGEDELDSAIKEQHDFLEQDPLEVLKILNRANLGFCDEVGPVDSIIIGAVDTDPLSLVNQQVFNDQKDLALEGIKLIKFLTSAKKVFLAIPRHLADQGTGIPSELAEVIMVDPEYPKSLPEILLRDLSRNQNLGQSIYIKVEKLIASVLALTRGKPFVHKLVTVVDKKSQGNFRIRIGTPIKEILNDNDITDNDKIIIGGPMRGYTCYNTDIPISDDMDLLVVQDASEVVLNQNLPCMSCGKCVKVCPVDLDVNLITRYSEFSIFEQCLELGIDKCIECGLCAYVCPSGRSLVQLIRLAKKEIQNIEGEEEE